VMICEPAEARPAFRVGVRGGTAESAARTAQMITPAHKLGVCASAEAQSPHGEARQKDGCLFWSDIGPQFYG
jgi:hypothetical protein